MTIILGINAYHGDSSACILKGGVLIAAAEEERFRRLKHWAGFPSEAIRYCLEEAGVGLEEVDHLAINQDAKANLWKKVSFTLGKRPELEMILSRFKNKQERSSVEEELEKALGGRFRGRVHHIEHHLAHLSSAFDVSPFNEAVVVSIDGFGDFASAAWGIGHGAQLTVEEKIYFPDSLGIFYQALTQWLGFPNYGDEYKVMGLAPYGSPVFMKEMREIVSVHDDGRFSLNLKYFRHHKEKIEYAWGGGDPSVGRLFTAELESLLGPARAANEELTQRHKDIARSVQAMYEEAFFSLLNVLHRRHRMDHLCLAGGCAMNSVANGKVYKNTPFKQLYVQSAAGDAGGAIGAAFVVWHEMGGARSFTMDHAYWGPSASDREVVELLDRCQVALKDQGCRVNRASDEQDLCEQVAQAIAAGKVIGWFQGRMEWGPRALGNRSILGDPRRADMKDVLNLKIKRRESFRPFAPSVLSHAVPEWFDETDDVPFMMQVYPIKEGKQALVPAVTHVDGSGRLQTVHERGNPRYFKLISRFSELTGVPMVLNTSFNENEPVVCRPEEALNCFMRTKMDMLALGDWIIERI
ncbi:MAG: carbamoyltransferase [Aquabacterium sp.]|uniref:carbamoyltransferase family protein n=1 Tax=Aquabacterium sp. TaxID=1872578 RepID=UPI0025BE4B91|nr:carbamoyltransferase C-terminal domain-containing protein [Aquabacterium sp.]MBI5925018.1 carbamoyltransferase [Aquabacterium sp.]